MRPGQVPGWPPDAFAVAAFILQRSGSYTEIVRDWPPGAFPQRWAAEMRRTGSSWRSAYIKGDPVPTVVRQWWSCVRRRLDLSVDNVRSDALLIAALAQILAAADEASQGVGIPDSEVRAFDKFDNDASRQLLATARQNASTLAKHLDASLYRVLPKLHTPQSGITIRSLSHHLAFCTAGEVNPKWIFHPPPSSQKSQRDGLNLLLVPWPHEISPLDFASVRRPPALRNMPPHIGFFSYAPNAATSWPSGKFKDLVASAVKKTGRIDGVILPELALRTDFEFVQACRDLSEIAPDAFLIAGIGDKGADGAYDCNRLGYRAAVTASLMLIHKQDKHHRWKLDESQIRQYGLTHRLDPYGSWWENTDLQERQVHFFSIAPWLTISALICEDLARQDPVADTLRAVGPNLIIALLMDGPQLQRRWSGRYATVFADDPGSSVLCLTSLGMTMLSTPLQPSADEQRTKRIIGLWKDARGSAREIELPGEVDAVVLSLNCEYRNEWTADGRDDGQTTAYLTFGRLHYV